MSELRHGERAQTAAALALANGGCAPRRIAEAFERAPAGALGLLEDEQGLLAAAALRRAAQQLDAWEREGISVLSPADPRYPDNLRAVHDRPPVLFVAGKLTAADEHGVAVIGSRAASASGLRRASEVARALIRSAFTVVSGLAAGIDTAAHTAALEGGGRTLAVIATGLGRCYPPSNSSLQEQIARRGAVISLRRPHEPPTRETFHARNALMSGISLASVIIEAGPRSGCRVQARAALAHGRPVLIHRSQLVQQWAQNLAAKPGVRPFSDPDEAAQIVAKLAREKTLTAT